MKIRTTINNLGLIKLKNTCAAKETISKTKRQPSKWEEIVTNEATDKELISKIYTELMQLNIKKEKLNKKWVET